MDDDWYNRVPLVRRHEVLLGACPAHDDGVDGFQVRRVRHQRNLAIVTFDNAVERRAEVVFDIARANVILRVLAWQCSDELCENLLLWLLDDVRQAVEAASVRHADDEGARTVFHSAIHELLEARDERFNAFNAKALHRVELLGDERRKRMSVVNARIKLELFIFGKGVVLNIFELMADPVALRYFLNVHELDANISLVGVLVGLNQVSELPFVRLCGDRSVEWYFEFKSLVEVGF